MSRISTHVLDTTLGLPAAGIVVHLEYAGRSIAVQQTDRDGRCANLLPGTVIEPGEYRLRFETGSYHQCNGLYPGGGDHGDGASRRHPPARSVTLESEWLYHV